VVRTIDGRPVTGYPTTDGGFASSDGTVYVDSSGKVETGITDPTTGNFLPNGTTRVIDGQHLYGTVQDGTFISEDGTVLQLQNGFVEHGTTDASGNFLASTTVDGRQVWGNYGSDGSFLSQDGKIYVPAGGAPEYGITDPTTGSFLPNGTTRVIDGQTLYGTVLDNGDFVSEDGTVLQLPNGFVEHGKTDASGNFLASTTVDGQQVWGNYGSDGSFLSQDGTIFIPAGGAPEYGVTDPASGSFLPGATTYTLSDGTVLYGYEDDGSFWSYDGSTIVLSDGTVVTGSLDQGDGIFTGNNGDDYLLGQNGIVQVTPNSDGSFTTSDGSVVMTPQSWQTDLSAFQAAQGEISTYIANIDSEYQTIRANYSVIEAAWSSPAGFSFTEATSTIDLAMQRLDLVLNSITSAMQTTYDNYYEAEQQAINQFNANSAT